MSSGVESFDLYVVALDGSEPLAVVPDVWGATWQPVAAPLPPAPSFAAVSPTP